jgi:alpha-L-fucosidase
MGNRVRRFGFVLAGVVCAGTASAADYTVKSIADLQSRIDRAVAGDTIVVDDGVYTTRAAISVMRSGTAKGPITVRAHTTGGVEIAGTHGFALRAPAAYVVIEGFRFTHASGQTSIEYGATHVRFSRNVFECAGPGAYLTIAGDDAEVDGNEFRNKKTLGNMIDVRGQGSQVAQRVWIHHNYFHDFANAGGNGAETIRFGLSGLSMSKGLGVVEHNLFVRCTGENELISNKSCANTYRYNTFLDSPGAQLTIRHGNECLVYGNNLRNTAGIRIFGDRHRVFSNYLEGNSIGINIGNGDGEVADGAALTSHDRPDGCVIASNTLVDNARPYFMGGRNKGLGATRTVFANNVLLGGGEAAVLEGPYTGGVWSGNILWKTAGAGAMPAGTYEVVDPRLEAGPNGVFRPQPGSPAIDAARGDYGVTVDMDGQPRTAPQDKGADEVSSEKPIAGILTPDTVAQAPSPAPGPAADAQAVRGEHATIGNAEPSRRMPHTSHPDAQWFGDADFGLFIHWGLSSVRAMNISWPMIPGRPLAEKRIESAEERERIVRESDYNLNGKPPAITPLEYWQMAKDFNPQGYDPDRWIKAAREAGFTYAVLTTKHHEGFALWPSAFGDFSTKTYMGGRDLLKPFVDACRKYGLKVGFYFSGPDWYFDRDYNDFLYGRARQRNPEFRPLGPDLKPRTTDPEPEALRKHQREYAATVKGQVEELLTRYGKIDLLWFDGRPRVPDAEKVIPIERIRELQPGIVVNPRLHGTGDYVTFERRLPATRPDVDWAEFCNTWTSSWSHQEIPFRSNAFVLGQLAQSRAWGINYLLGVGPMASGEMTPGVYENMSVVRDWMKANGRSILGARPLPAGETASVPATSHGAERFLFAIPRFKGDGAYPEDQLPPPDETLTLSGLRAKPTSVSLLGTGRAIAFRYADGVVTVPLAAAARSTLVDVVRIELQ